jgi:hypothetical protein
MTNEEMFRPCTLWGQTFDAMDVLSIKSTENNIVIDLDTCKLINGHPIYGSLIKSPFYDECPIESMRYIHEAITTIAEALNAPVVLTKAVFENLPIDVYQLHYIASLEPDYIYLVRYNKTLKKWTFRTGMTLELFDVPIHKISGCNQIGKDYLLQFTLDGKRKETT